ncbi:MAG: acyltransferase [Candidatus Margulisiibacteriota bacterium]
MRYITVLSKILKKEITLADMNSHAYFETFKRWSGFWGTVNFRIKARIFGVKAGKKVKCYGPIDILRAMKSTIEIGDNVSFVSSSKRGTASSIYSPVRLRTWNPNSKILIGSNSGLNGTSITSRSKTISIGQGVMIAPNVVIVDSDFHAYWPPENRAVNPGFESDADVTISRNVWVGMNSIILKGANIGENSIIGAGSVVTGSIPANVVAAGVPARVIKNLSGGSK